MRALFRTILGLLALSLPHLALADDRKLCKSNKTEYQARLEACDRLIAAATDPDDLWPLAWRGDAHENAEIWDLALADYGVVLTKDPEHAYSWRGVLYIYYRQKRFAEALEVTDTLIRIDSENSWVWNMRGVSYEKLGQPEAALAAYETATTLTDSWDLPYINAGDVLFDQGNVDGALGWYLKAAEIDPFDARPQRFLGKAYREMGETQSAANAYLYAATVDPNDRTSTHYLDQTSQALGQPVGEGLAIELPPAPYVAPAPVAITYLESFVKADQRSEMEQAIGALADWFAPTPRAEPEALALFTRTLTAEPPDIVHIGWDRVDSWKLDQMYPDGKYPPYSRSFRGLMPVEFPPPEKGGPTARVVFESGDPSGLWPLKVGNYVTGTGAFHFLCPEEFNLGAVAMGCFHEVEFVEVGKLEHEILIERAERVHVPMGLVDTFVLRFRFKGTMEAMGRKMERTAEFRFWYDPALGFWVKRTNERNGRIVTRQAVEVAAVE